MSIPFRARSLTMAVMAGIALIGCGKDGTGPNDPDDPNRLTLFVAPQPDPAFASNGQVVFDLVPGDQNGSVFLDDAWTAAVTIVQPGATTATFMETTRQTPDATPVAAALDIDDSRSMLVNDPDRQRIAAAKVFWETLIDGQPNSLVALLDFGNPTPSTGFATSRLFQALTSDKAALESKLPSLQPGETSGGSRLFESSIEVVNYISSTIPSGSYRRVLVVVTDGKADDPAKVPDLISAANSTGTRVFAVGIGPASDRSDDTDATAVANLRDVANGTGGVYAGASSANTLQAVFQTLATSQIQSKLLSRFNLSPVPASGTEVRGTITLTGPKGTVSSSFSFIAP